MAENLPINRLKKKTRFGESIIKSILLICGVVSILTTLGIVYELGKESLLFFQTPGVNIFQFLTGTVWQPAIGKFGILPLLNATLITTFFAMLIALPLGLGAAIYLSEYASTRVRKTIKPTLEVLAGVPTVVYGYFALTVMTPFLRFIFGSNNVQIYNMLSAGLVMGIMILPLVCSISEDALHAVPHSLREAALVWEQPVLKPLSKLWCRLHYQESLQLYYWYLTCNRRNDDCRHCCWFRFSIYLQPIECSRNHDRYIARISGGDVAYDTPEYNSIFAIGLLLFLVTLSLNLVSRKLSARFREVYE